MVQLQKEQRYVLRNQYRTSVDIDCLVIVVILWTFSKLWAVAIKWRTILILLVLNCFIKTYIYKYIQLFRTLNLQYDSDYCYNSDLISAVFSAFAGMSTIAWENVIRSVDLCNLNNNTYFVCKACTRSVAVTLCLAFFAALSSHSSSSWRRATTPSWSSRLVRLSAPCFSLYACCILSRSSAASDASSSFRKEYSNRLSDMYRFDMKQNAQF